jgi:hypothetical protein
MLGVAAIGWIMAFAIPAFGGSFDLLKSFWFGVLFTGAAAFSWFLSASTALGVQMWQHRAPRRPRPSAHVLPFRMPDEPQRTPGNPATSGRIGKPTIALAISLAFCRQWLSSAGNKSSQRGSKLHRRHNPKPSMGARLSLWTATRLGSVQSGSASST